MGYHIPIFPHAPGPCRVLDDVVAGSYSMTMLFNTSIVLIATGFLDGGIYVYDMSSLDGFASLLNISGDFDSASLYPHSISSYTNPQTSQVTVFVANRHRARRHRIEKFIYHKMLFLLQHIETIEDISINFVDDILAVGEDTFYFSNRFHHTDELSMKIETYAMFSWGTVIFYNGSDALYIKDTETYKYSKGEVVARGYMPAGLALSPDKRHIYVAGNQEIKVRK